MNQRFRSRLAFPLHSIADIVDENNVPASQLTTEELEEVTSPMLKNAF